jgi:plastocyanin
VKGRRKLRFLGRGLVLVVVGTFGFGVTACGGDDQPSGASGGGEAVETSGGEAGGTEVEIVDFEFAPQELTVAAGTTVTWTNEDSAPHAVQDDSDLGADESEDLAQGDTFQLTYDEPGTYPYVCGIHNYMTGTVVVE